MHLLIYLLFLLIGSTITLFIWKYSQSSFLKEFHKEQRGISYLKRSLEKMLDEIKSVGSDVTKGANGKKESLEKLIKEADHRIKELNLLLRKQEEDPKYMKIYQLHKEGKSLNEIARKVNMNKGEIELILRLPPRFRSSSEAGWSC